MKKSVCNKKKLIVGFSAGAVVAASGIAIAITANNNSNNNNQNVVPSVNNISVSFGAEGNAKVQSNKLISEPVGYTNHDLQLQVYDDNGAIVEDAIFETTNLPEGINISRTGVLNGVAIHDGIYYTNIKVHSPSLQASTSLDNIEIDVPKPIEVNVQDAQFVEVIKGSKEFSIATNNPNDHYEIITGTLPQGIVFNNTTGVFSGTAQETGMFNLTVEVTNPEQEFSYADIQVHLYVETIDEALTIGAEEIAQKFETNVNQFNTLVDSLTNTLNVIKGVYAKDVEIVQDANNIINNVKNTYTEIVGLLKDTSAIFTADWWKDAGNAALSKAELTIEQYSDQYFLPIASVVDGVVNTIGSLQDSLGPVLSVVGVELPNIQDTYQKIINMVARVLTGDKVYLTEFTDLFDVFQQQLNELKVAFDAIISYAPTDEQTLEWQKQIDELKALRDQYPAFVDEEGSIPDGSKTEGSILKTTAEWRNVTYKLENGEVIITGGEAKHSLLTASQWIPLVGSDYVNTTCDANGHIEIKLFNFVTIVSFDAPANPERFAIQQQIDEIQAKIDAASITSGLLDSETKEQIASISAVIDTVIDVIAQAKDALPAILESIAQVGIDGIQLPWTVLENVQVSELTSLTDIANAIHEDYLFNLDRWNTFSDKVTGIYNGVQKSINDVQQIISDVEALVTKIQVTVADAQEDITNTVNDNIAQLKQFVAGVKDTFHSIEDLLDIINTVA